MFIFDFWIEQLLLLYFLPYFIAGKITQNDMNNCAKKKEH